MEKLFSNPGEVFFGSGSTLLDLALGGGWALRRIFNLVGDKSTGKTLVAIESFANFKIVFPDCRMRYAEAEAALDEKFASQLGFPDEVERPEDMLHTVEEFRDDLAKFLNPEKKSSRDKPGLYILDSLDALSDEAEQERFKARMEGKKEKGSMGAQKAKEMSELFRLLTGDIKKSNCALGVISQLRDNVGATYGEPSSRSGGRAMDFYASQIVWLYQTGKLTKSVKNDTRAIGVETLAKVKKCKVGLPFREVDFNIIFGYGIDDEISMLTWLKERGEYKKETFEEMKDQLEKARAARDFALLGSMHESLKQDTVRVWEEMERKLAPKIQKYNNPLSEMENKNAVSAAGSKN